MQSTHQVRKWVVIFRGIAGHHGGTNDICGLWRGSSTRHDGNKAAQTPGYYSLGHYKSRDVEDWNAFGFKQVNMKIISYFKLAANKKVKNY